MITEEPQEREPVGDSGRRGQRVIVAGAAGAEAFSRGADTPGVEDIDPLGGVDARGEVGRAPRRAHRVFAAGDASTAASIS